MKQELRFTVAGEDGATYQVIFTRRDKVVTASCNCPDGKPGSSCAHRVGLLAGNRSALTDGDAALLPDLQEMIRGTDVGLAYTRYANAEAALNAAQTTFERARVELGKAMLY